jgi:hypothetical protein
MNDPLLNADVYASPDQNLGAKLEIEVRHDVGTGGSDTE